MSVCVGGGGGGGGGNQAHSPYVHIHEMRAFIIIRIYNNSIIISMVKHTGEDKDNLTQYICRCVQHCPATTPLV